MPLDPGRSREAFGGNVAELEAAGHPRAQALAIAYRKAGEDVAEDMADADWRALLGGLLKFFGEEAGEPEHAGDETEVRELQFDAKWSESDHPRGESGQFGSGMGMRAAEQHREKSGYHAAERDKYEPPQVEHKAHALAAQLHESAARKHEIGHPEATAASEKAAKYGARAKEIACGRPEAGRAIKADPSKPDSPYGGKEKGFAHGGSGNLKDQGFKPKRSGASGTVTQAAQIGWGRAIETGESQTLAMVRGGFQLVKPGDRVAYGQPHIVVAPDGTVHAYKSSITDDYRLEHAEDALLRRDRYALDKAPENRTTSPEGHMHVRVNNISKANVCPYLGEEIPGWEELGLDPKAVYRLYRHPTELRKGTPTLNGKPLLLVHKPTTAGDHPRELTVGSVGTNARFADPYLQNSLAIWDAEGVHAVESEEQNELSPGYQYRPDMTPGRTPDGEPYDGVMRDIVINHVALVEEGRTGSDVVVGDSAMSVFDMSAFAADEAYEAYDVSRFSDDPFNAARFGLDDQPRDPDGKFGSGSTAKTSAGYSVKRSSGPAQGHTTYEVSHPKSSKTHVVVHDPKGNVVNHHVASKGGMTPLGKKDSGVYAPIHAAISEAKGSK